MDRQGGGWPPRRAPYGGYRRLATEEWGRGGWGVDEGPGRVQWVEEGQGERGLRGQGTGEGGRRGGWECICEVGEVKVQ